VRPFVIEIYWPDMTSELVAALVARATAVLVGREGAIRYLGCEVAPRDETCFLRVVAMNGDAVNELVAALSLEGVRVSELVDVSPPARPATTSARTAEP
jgi:hypothetical protein